MLSTKITNMAHLTSEQRYTIASMNAKGFSRKEICKAIDKGKSVLSRELKRNADARNGEYRACLAQRKHEARQAQKPKRHYFTDEIQAKVEEGLSDGLSPEQIVGLAKKEGGKMVSVERVYQFVWENKQKGGTWYQYLRAKGKKYRSRGQSKDKRGQIVGRVDIGNRPAIVEARGRFGDLEIDTIIGKDHKGAILTINDRATGYLKMKKLPSKEAAAVEKAAIELLKDWKPFLHTITADNGKEFANHLEISGALGIGFYFARPHHPWERGSNENLNGLIRQYIPKKTDFSQISDGFIQEIEDKINRRPRKRFGYESPQQKVSDLFSQKVAFVT